MKKKLCHEKGVKGINSKNFDNLVSLATINIYPGLDQQQLQPILTTLHTTKEWSHKNKK